METHGTVSKIVSIVLSRTSQPTIIRFEVEYAPYKERIERVNRAGYQRELNEPLCIQIWFNPEPLRGMWIMGDIEGESIMEDATEEKLSALFAKGMGSNAGEFAERLQLAMKIVLHEPFPRILRSLFDIYNLF